MRRALALALLLTAGPASADQWNTQIYSDMTRRFTDTNINVYPLMIRDGSVVTFKMSEGACLVGPIVFNNKDGKIIFQLQAGVSYPEGCK